VLVHSVRTLLQIDTDPARLRSINKSKYAKYAKYAKYDLVSVGPCTLPALKYRCTCGTACQCLCMDFEQEQKFAEPYVIHSELERAIRYPGLVDKHHVRVLAIGLLQFPQHKWPL
jgi:hypothetical protein